MNINVGGDTMRVDFDRTHSPVIQNLGPSYLWVARKGVPSEDGVRLEPGGTLAFGGPMLDSGPAYVLVQATQRDNEDPVAADMRLDPAPRGFYVTWSRELLVAAGLEDDYDTVEAAIGSEDAMDTVASDEDVRVLWADTDQAWAMIVDSGMALGKMLAGSAGVDPAEVADLSASIMYRPMMEGWFGTDEFLPLLFTGGELPEMSNVDVSFADGTLQFLRTAQEVASHEAVTVGFGFGPADRLYVEARCDTLGDSATRMELLVEAPDGAGGWTVVHDLDGEDTEMRRAVVDVADAGDGDTLRFTIETAAFGGDAPYLAEVAPFYAFDRANVAWEAVESATPYLRSEASFTDVVADPSAVDAIFASQPDLRLLLAAGMPGLDYSVSDAQTRPVEVTVAEGTVTFVRQDEYSDPLVLEVGAPVDFDVVDEMRVPLRADTLGESASRFTVSVVVDGATLLEVEGDDGQGLAERIIDTSAVTGEHRIQFHVNATTNGLQDPYEVEIGAFHVVKTA